MKALQEALKTVALGVAKREGWTRPDVIVSYAATRNRMRVLVSVSGRTTDTEVKSRIMCEFGRLHANQRDEVRATWPEIDICTMVFVGTTVAGSTIIGETETPR